MCADLRVHIDVLYRVDTNTRDSETVKQELSMRRLASQQHWQKVRAGLRDDVNYIDCSIFPYTALGRTGVDEEYM